MGVLQIRPKLDPGEQLRWKCLANRVVGKIDEGGQLVVTDRRVLFQPNRVDASLGHEGWECPLGGVTAVELVGRDGSLFAGGVRKRLGLRTEESLEVFVVNRVKKKMAELNALLPGLRTPGRG